MMCQLIDTRQKAVLFVVKALFIAKPQFVLKVSVPVVKELGQKICCSIKLLEDCILQ